MTYPNMNPELFEAIHEYWKGEPEVEADILLYLSKMVKDEVAPKKLSAQAECELTERGRCYKCGAKLEHQVYYEPHTEVDPPCYEKMSVEYCPNCDIVGQMGLF